MVMPVIPPANPVTDPIVFSLDLSDKRARNAYEQTAAYWFEHFVSWNNLTTAERDYWRERVV